MDVHHDGESGRCVRWSHDPDGHLAARASSDRAVFDIDRELADWAGLDLVDDRTSLLGTEVEEIRWIRSGLDERLSFWF